ncbi:MAG: uroporphyrinogen-III synthase [Sphingomonadaceae bacterium]|nr:uroporphyrinogen-III synthase [Sphingomonadaceae bacterium]
MKLLILRPQPGADATAVRVRAAGHEPLLMPLFVVEPVDWTALSPGDYDKLLLTSANSVRHAGTDLAKYRDLPVLAVGQNTADAARGAGLSVEHIGNSGVDELLAKVDHCRLLWLTGEDRVEPQYDPSIRLDTHIVYRSTALPAPEAFEDFTRSADHVLLHSPRAARHFGFLLAERNLAKSAISIAALSPNIAQAAGHGWKSVFVASGPSDKALLSCL